MEQTVLALVGVIVGGAITLWTQSQGYKFLRQDRRGTGVLDSATTVISLAEDYKNRMWEERNGLSSGAIESWDIARSADAHTRLRLLSNDEALHAASKDLKASGTRLGKAWRLTRIDGPEVEDAWQDYKRALDAFTAAAGVEVQRQYR